MIRKLFTLALIALPIVFAGCVSRAVRLQRTVGKSLSAAYGSEHFELHFRPGAVPEPELARLTHLLDGELTRISTLLKLDPSGRYSIYLFKNSDEMRAETGEEKQVGAFAWNGACYAPLDNDPALVHELVHLIADAKISRNAGVFVAEGLAEALPEFSKHMDADTSVKYYREMGDLPPLARFVAAKRLADVQFPGDKYEIAASWMRFLFESYGPEKLKIYYSGATPKNAFGHDLDTLEKAWLARADRYEFSTVERAILSSRDGKPAGKTFTLLAGDSFHITIVGSPLSKGSRLVWTKNGNPFPEAKGLELDFYPITPVDAGIYVLSTEQPGKAPESTEIKIEVVDPSALPPARELLPPPQ